jgi:hypothetical protein
MFNRGAFLALTLIGSLLTSLLPITLANAQTNAITQLVPFQGRLHDSEGKVVDDGVYDLTFYVYDTATGGAFVWSENHAQVSVIHGYVNVLLGGTESGKFADKNVDFSTQKYLSISINGGQEMFPRHQLVPTFHSYDAHKLGGKDPDYYATDLEVIKIVERVDEDISDVDGKVNTLITDRFGPADINKAKKAAYADTAGNALKLDNETKAQLRDASKLTGTISDARLPSIISRGRLQEATTASRGATKKNHMHNATNGYFWDKETGFIMQWGYNDANLDTNVWVSFPVAVTTIYNVTTSLQLNDSWSGFNGIYVASISTTGFNANRNDNLDGSVGKFYWQAIGYKAP